jgi:hypothetical protein
MKDICFMLPKAPPCYVQLGRYGDLILLFPAFFEVYRRTGLKPIVMVSNEYASVFDGISYAVPWVVPYNWWQGIPAARHEAQLYYRNVIVPQFWNDRDSHEEIGGKVSNGAVVLQCHGFQWGVNIGKWPNFMSSMWDRAGFTKEEMMTLPLFFDRRDKGREEALAKSVSTWKRPVLLYNFRGVSSPFAFEPEITRILQTHRNVFEPVDLGRVRAERIYDLLGLYDRAAGILTSDTATLHLAHASKTPYIAFTVDGWSGSYPRGNCQFSTGYNSVPSRFSEINNVITKWEQTYASPHLHFLPAEGLGNSGAESNSQVNLGTPAVA